MWQKRYLRRYPGAFALPAQLPGFARVAEAQPNVQARRGSALGAWSAAALLAHSDETADPKLACLPFGSFSMLGCGVALRRYPMERGSPIKPASFTTATSDCRQHTLSGRNSGGCVEVVDGARLVPEAHDRLAGR